jgi:hypothetical protein
MMKNVYLIIFCLFCFSKVKAQGYTRQARIRDIKEDGLHKIALSPELKQYMTADLRDTRVLDSSGREVPYVLLSEALLKSKSDFVEYRIVSQKHFKTYSEVIIHNANKDKINNIAFNINNTDAYKYCAIEGSEDLKQWYSVSAQQELSVAYNQAYTNSYKCIYFPLNNYSYFRLLVDDWEAQPLKINSVGYFKNSVIAGKLNDVMVTKKINEDVVNKKTKIQLSFSNNQMIHRIDFKVKSPRLYLRQVDIYANREQQTKHRKSESYRELLCSFILSSDSSLMIDVPHINEKEIFIEIENKDSPPLEIEFIHCKQLASYLVCDLNANNKYSLNFGNVAIKIPEYDLRNFVSVIPQLLPEATLETILEIPKTPEIKKQPSFFETKQFLWLCLVIGAIAIFFFSRSLLKDISKKS